MISLIQHSLIIDQPHNIDAQLERRVVGASLSFSKPNVARGDGDDWVAGPGRESDVAVMAGSVDVEVMGSHDFDTGERGAAVPSSVVGYNWLIRGVAESGGQGLREFREAVDGRAVGLYEIMGGGG